MHQPRITIVTPSFNRGWSIRSCIESLRSQTFVDYEHIIVDGGSTDDTLKILHEVSEADSRIKYITEPDNGMYDAVNKGMRLASSEIVAYLNTDDFYLPHTLEQVLRAFAENPDVSMLYGHWMSWHSEINFLEILPVLNYSAADLALFAVLPQPSVFFKRKVFESIGGFDLSYKLLADNDFFSKAAVNGFKFKRIDEYLAVQTVHSGNLLAGNADALLQAKYEGDCYRQARIKELSNGGCKFAGMTKAHIHKFILPISWRLYFLYRWLLRDDADSAEFRSKFFQMECVQVSSYSLFRYVFCLSKRCRYVFCTVGVIKFANMLGFMPPNCNLASLLIRSD